jgi:hypothetical protein
MHDSNLNSTFISMDELEFILLIKVSTQNSNIVEFVKFLKKIKNFTSIVGITLKMTSYKTLGKNKNKN